MPEYSDHQRRLLVLAPVGRDAPLACVLLRENRVSCRIADSISDLILEAKKGAAALLVTEEALKPEPASALNAFIGGQLDWSDLPVIVLACPAPGRDRRRMIVDALGPGRNINVLERPIRSSTLKAVVHSAIKTRERQYQVRDLLSKLESIAVKLEQSNTALQDFAYIASHDLQEPLRKIETFGGLLASEFDSIAEEQGKDYLGRMQNAASRMRAFIQDLLNYSCVSTEVEPPRRINLKTVVQDVLSALEVPISQTNANITIGDLPEINADAVQMHQLFQNLIGNALKFHGDEPPVIEVSSPGCSDAICEIRIRDNGIGFDQKCAERIFAPFQRLHGRSRFEGSGMGLAICKKIVERHGGTIRAESAPGDGATFVIHLPTG